MFKVPVTLQLRHTHSISDCTLTHTLQHGQNCDCFSAHMHYTPLRLAHLLVGIGRPDVGQGGCWVGAVGGGGATGQGLMLGQAHPCVSVHSLHKDAQQGAGGDLW